MEEATSVAGTAGEEAARRAAAAAAEILPASRAARRLARLAGKPAAAPCRAAGSLGPSPVVVGPDSAGCPPPGRAQW
jgi:hypothetical protein